MRKDIAYWLIYAIGAVLGNITAPFFCHFLGWRVDKPYFTIGTIITTVVLVALGLQKRSKTNFLVAALCGFFSFISILLIGEIATLIVRVRIWIK